MRSIGMTLREALRQGGVLALIIFGVLEVAFRIHGTRENGPLTADPVLNHTWKPNSTFVHREWMERGIPPYVHAYNSQAWIAPADITPEPSPGRIRLFFLGDSFTEGTCPEMDSLPATVKRYLNEHGRDDVEVINTGTASYSPVLYYILLKQRILKFHPRVIVINVDMTDVFDDQIYRATTRFDADGNPESCGAGHPLAQTYRRTVRGLEHVGWFAQVSQGIVAHSAFLSALQLKIFSLTPIQVQVDDSRETIVPPLFEWCAFARTQETQAHVNWSMNILGALIDLAHREGVIVVLTGVPHRQQLIGSWSLEPFRDLERVAKSHGAEFLDPVPQLRKVIGDVMAGEFYIKNDMHFNPDGYRLWGEVQGEFLLKMLNRMDVGGGHQE